MKHKCPQCGYHLKGSVETLLEETWSAQDTVVATTKPREIWVKLPKKAKIYDEVTVEGKTFYARPLIPLSDKTFTWVEK